MPGGVEVDVPMEINDDEAGGHVDAGEQTLSGEEALILCRSRHSYDEYGDGDRYRAANQRLVLGAIAKKILSADPATMANTISALSQYITTDFKVGDIVALATSMQGIDPSKDIYSAMEPTISEYKNDTWYEQLDVAAWNTMMGRVREGLPPTEVDEVDELNGTVLASVGDGKAAASDSEGVQGVNGHAAPDLRRDAHRYRHHQERQRHQRRGRRGARAHQTARVYRRRLQRKQLQLRGDRGRLRYARSARLRRGAHRRPRLRPRRAEHRRRVRLRRRLPHPDR